MKTPDWILEGFDSKADYEKAKGITSEKTQKSKISGPRNQRISKISSEKGKTFKVRECPKCKSDDVGLVLSNSDAEEGGGKEWECRKCKWIGSDIDEKELTEKELMEHMDKKGEEVA